MIPCVRGWGDAAEVLPTEHKVGSVIPALLSEEMQFDVYLVAR